MRSEDVEVTYPNGDTFDLNLEEAKLLLHRFGIPKLRIDKIIDKLWNFYAIRLEVSGDFPIVTLPAQEYPDQGARPLEQYDWVFGPGKVR